MPRQKQKVDLLEKIAERLDEFAERLEALEGAVYNRDCEDGEDHDGDCIEYRYVIRASIKCKPGTKCLPSKAYYVGQLFNPATGITESLWVVGNMNDGSDIHDIVWWPTLGTFHNVFDRDEDEPEYLDITRPNKNYEYAQLVRQKRVVEGGEDSGWVDDEVHCKLPIWKGKGK